MTSYSSLHQIQPPILFCEEVLLEYRCSCFLPTVAELSTCTGDSKKYVLSSPLQKKIMNAWNRTFLSLHSSEAYSTTWFFPVITSLASGENHSPDFDGHHFFASHFIFLLINHTVERSLALVMFELYVFEILCLFHITYVAYHCSWIIVAWTAMKVWSVRLNTFL